MKLFFGNTKGKFPDLVCVLHLRRILLVYRLLGGQKETIRHVPIVIHESPSKKVWTTSRYSNFLKKLWTSYPDTVIKPRPLPVK